MSIQQGEIDEEDGNLVQDAEESSDKADELRRAAQNAPEEDVSVKDPIIINR